MERDHRSISAVDGVMFRQVGTRAGADRVDRPDAQRRPRVLRAGVAGKPGALRVRAGPEPGGGRGIPIGANRRVAPHLATTASRESGCMPLRHSSRSGGVLVGHRSALGGWEMTGAHADQIVDGHLKCLEASLASLPSNRRPELTSQISDTSRKRGRSSRRKRRRRPDHPGSPGPARRDRHRSRHYAQGLDRRTWANRHAGPFVDRSWRRDFPYVPVAWVIGIDLVWRSKSWTPRQKFYGAYLPFVIGLVLLVAGAIASGLGPHLLGVLLVVLIVAFCCR